MTPELIGITTVGIALAALNFTMFNMLSKRLERLEDRVSDMDRRLARLEGLVDGIRESLFDRVKTEV